MERHLAAILVADVTGYSRRRGSRSSFMRRLFTILLLALTILPASTMADVGDVTNDTVIALLRAGLSDEAIVAVVDRPHTDFDVEPEALIRLREEGLSNAVIVAIIAAERRARPAETPSVAVPPVAVELPVVRFELMFWDSIKHSTSAADYEAYLLQYPYGHFTVLAVARLETMRERAAAPAAAPSGVSSTAWPDAPMSKTRLEAPAQVVPAAPLTEGQLMRDGGLMAAVSGFAEAKYRFEIETFTRMRIVVQSNTRVVIETSYLWGNDDTNGRTGRGMVTLRRNASSYQVVGFESHYPTSIQLYRFDHGASGI